MGTLNFLTGNLGKIAEAENLLGPLNWQIKSFEIEGEVPEIIEPQSDNLTTVALAKIAQGVELLASQNRLNESLLVEDSGLFIDALPNFPGVYSSDVLKSIGCEGILRLLDDARAAHFLTVAALWTGEAVEVFVGRCDGQIAREIKGQDGFGYDPIFYVPTHGCTSAELSDKQKNELSHRGQALRSLTKKLIAEEKKIDTNIP